MFFYPPDVPTGRVKIYSRILPIWRSYGTRFSFFLRYSTFNIRYSILFHFSVSNLSFYFISPDKFSVSFWYEAFSIFNGYLAAEQYGFYFAGTGPTFIGRVIDIHMMCIHR